MSNERNPKADFGLIVSLTFYVKRLGLYSDLKIKKKRIKSYDRKEIFSKLAPRDF